MPYKKSLVKKLCTIKVISMAILMLLALIYFLILILNQNFRSSILDDRLFLAAFFITWLCLIISFFSSFMDFVLMRKNREIARDLNDLSFLDRLTGLPNRYSMDRILPKFDTPGKLLHLGIVLMVLDNLREINETKGRSSGDKVIADFCSILESVGPQYGLIGRNSGNEFLLIMEDCDRNTAELFLGDLGRRIHNHNAISSDLPISISYASVLSDNIAAEHFYSVIASVYRNHEESPQTLS